MKCFWCGKENKNIEITEKNEIFKNFPCDECNLRIEQKPLTVCSPLPKDLEKKLNKSFRDWIKETIL